MRDPVHALRLHRRWLRSGGLRGARLVLAGGVLPERGLLFDADLARADLRAADLVEENLGSAGLADADLRGADLRESLLGRSLRRADLRGADCRNARFEVADLRGADLRGADLRGAELYGCRLQGARFTGADMVGCRVRGAVLEPIRRDLLERLDVVDRANALAEWDAGSLLHRLQRAGDGAAGHWLEAVAAAVDRGEHPFAELLRSWIESWSAEDEPLGWAEALDLHQEWLETRGEGGRRLVRPGADLEGQDLSGALLRLAHLRGADLEGASLVGADLSDADLRDSRLVDADLRDADLRGADLRGASLGGACLRADLTDADLRGAELDGAVVERLCTRRARFSSAEQLLGADLTAPRRDLWALLNQVDADGRRHLVPGAVRGLVAALDGGTFDGDAPLFDHDGDPAAVRRGGLAAALSLSPGVDRQRLARQSAERPAEAFASGVGLEDTPASSPVAEVLRGWLDEFLECDGDPAVVGEEPEAQRLVGDALARALAAHAAWRASGGDAGRRLRALDLDLSGADLGGLDLRGADLRKAVARGVVLRGALLAGADLSGADLTGADLRDQDLADVRLLDTRLEQADLRGVDLTRALTTDLWVDRADLRGARLRGLELEEGGFAGADLTGVDLRGVSLQYMDLRGAILDGVQLAGAVVSGPLVDAEALRRARLEPIREALLELVDALGDDAWEALASAIEEERFAGLDALFPRGWRGEDAEREHVVRRWLTGVEETPATDAVARLTVEWLRG